jgi:hypothetical protein
VGLLETLFGRTKSVRSRTQALFGISTASVTLQTKLMLTPARKAGIVFKPVESSYFTEAESQVQAILQQSGKDDNLRYSTETDSFGYRWVIVEHESFEQLVAAIHMVSITLSDNGFGDQLLAAVFRFDGARGPVYWLYNYKRGAFYPLVPAGGQQQRDNGEELRYAAVMKGELVLEKNTTRWYALWGIPF